MIVDEWEVYYNENVNVIELFLYCIFLNHSGLVKEFYSLAHDKKLKRS